VHQYRLIGATSAIGLYIVATIGLLAVMWVDDPTCNVGFFGSETCSIASYVVNNLILFAIYPGSIVIPFLILYGMWAGRRAARRNDKVWTIYLLNALLVAGMAASFSLVRVVLSYLWGQSRLY
jgi:hypothetical protein